MGDDANRTKDVLSELTAQEQAVLVKALKRVESDVFHAVVKKIGVFLASIAAILTVAGFVSFSSLSSSIEGKAVDKLSNDPQLREKVQTELLRKSEALDKETSLLERENARAATTLVNSISEIHEMIKQIVEDVEKRKISEGNKNSPKQ